MTRIMILYTDVSGSTPVSSGNVTTKLVPLIERAVCNLVAVAALPVQELDEPLMLPVKYPTTFALIVDGNFKVTLPEPLTLTALPV